MRLRLWIIAATALGVLAAGAASPALASERQAGARAAAADDAPATCIVHSLPSFIAQGEGAIAATVADIVEVECNPVIYGTKSKIKLIASQLFSRCEGKLTWLVPDQPAGGEGQEGFIRATGIGVSVELDADGNGTAALLAGPGCAAGESLISAHMEEQPFETFTTSFTVLPPQTTPPGLYALPGTQVEDSFSSAFATIVEAEFAEGSEKHVRIASEELYRRCRLQPHLRWFHFGLGSGQPGIEETDGPEINGIELDNDGNAFVVAVGDSSCAPGASLIEGDLEAKPFTTFTTIFATEPPQPTAEPAFTIEKLQEIEGSGAGLTASPLIGQLGQTVDYEIVVRNTSTVAETFGELSDQHCDAGTLLGGVGSGALAPGEATTYMCSHRLTTVGAYINEATITANTVGGVPITHTSNQVLVEVPAAPAFKIEKRQRLAGSGGSFTTSRVTGALGQKVEYQITVTNTGNEPLTLSGFSDPRCDGGTISGGPGETQLALGASTTYTCSHVLTSVGSYINEAAVTGTPEGQAPITHASNQVEALAAKAEAKPETVSSEPKPKITVLPRCERALPALPAASGAKRTPFKVRLNAGTVKLIIVYLDGRKLKTLKPAQARGGKFTILIDPRRLSYGAHRLLIKARAKDPNCASIARSGVFVHPQTIVFKPAG